MSADAAAIAALESALRQALVPASPDAGIVTELRRLSGGASQETWAFMMAMPDGDQRLILRRTPGGRDQGGTAASVPLTVEAKLLELAREADVPVPRVRRVLDPGDGIGAGFVMDFVDGETIPRKILRDAEYAEARAGLARTCGAVLARIHAIDPAAVPELRPQTARDQVRQYRQIYDALDDPRPVFELAFRWLDDHAPAEVPPRVVHGDFRNGNLIVGADGLRAVLDWELAHVGDPFEDLGWICVCSWRFGEIDKPVGGFGSREELFAAYEEAGGGAVDPARVRYWEVFGTLKWGVICMMMYGAYRSGLDRSVERAAIGRRTSETEIDLLELLVPREGR
jgi:aminoglycoside phosphotransferase (APT) family kinase protein